MPVWFNVNAESSAVVKAEGIAAALVVDSLDFGDTGQQRVGVVGVSESNRSAIGQIRCRCVLGDLSDCIHNCNGGLVIGARYGHRH